ncbi:MAG: cobyric acid synthase [Proteobacteria bacterium]|nr:cobyric acid synthase [Pseudomonadota bacterium]MBU2262278.1 cobyric acid synthase [Pseudomonadota bacterium]
MTERHGGNIAKLAAAAGKPAGEILDFSANINPLGLPEWLRPLISSRVGALVHYPDPDCTDLVRAFAEHHDVCPDEILMGNGETELLYLLPRVLGKARAVIPVPAYVDYAAAAEQAGMAIATIPLREEMDFYPDLGEIEAALRGDEIAFLGRPNNPTGIFLPADALREIALRRPETAFVVDEAFADFVSGESLLAGPRPANLVVLRSLTKFYAIPGLRLGAVVADREIIRRLRAILPPWSVNTLAQAVGAAALRDAGYAEETRQFVGERRAELVAELEAIPGLTVYPGTANFLLIRIDRGDIAAPELAGRLLADGIAVRVCDNFAGLDRRFFRVAVRTAGENGRLCRSLCKALGIASKTPVRRRTPVIMFQGTGSNAGKSILAAALCRILLQDGCRVAPFKAQNMSLNSYVTRDGGEMGRAQVVQAQACKIDPDVRMNPVLLKPNSDTGSQVIVLGKPVGNMDFWEYTRDRTPPFSAAKGAFDSLAAEYDAIVMEGAGSPGEVNLKKRDIVNMNMAIYADAPVLIVGDIDRGGIYASFIGTMEVLSERERALVKGFVVNRFRGREEFLAEAHEYVLSHTERPVLGVVPYLRDLGLPEEDSVSFKDGLIDGRIPAGDHVDVAIIDLAHISNFTDFDPLRIEPDVRLRVVRNPAELGTPDAVILPGSKNVIGDLAGLQASGMAERIMALARGSRTEIIGICGGLQIMGREIGDPFGIESAGGRSLPGLGLLPGRTTLAREKTLKRVAARHLNSGCEVYGYEIHHGLTDGGHLAPLIRREDGEAIGVGMEDGLLWGTYLHGIFDADGFRRWFIDHLRVRRGLAPLGRIAAVYDLEPAFERLAATVRRSLRMDEIYRIMGI